MPTKAQLAEREEYRQKLLGVLKPGDTVFTILRHVSRSGMSRKIDLYIIKDGEPFFLSGWAAGAMGMRWDRDSGGIIVGGCGMDMGFHLVYTLSYTLWPKGHECIGEDQKCPSNDHTNERGRGAINYSPDRIHSDGGYALRQRWI